MPLRFNALLEDAGISPRDVRLLRHQPMVAGRSLIDVWRADPGGFEAYQALQAVDQRTRFGRPFWASFIGTCDGRTMFAGLYEAGLPVMMQDPFMTPVSGDTYQGGTYDRYEIRLSNHLEKYAGRLFVEWGGGSSGKRAWVQRADAQDKAITELARDQADRPFPGLMALEARLSSLADAPPSWIEALSKAKGVYLLTCPRENALYVGSATGGDGFWGRWADYRANGHGGNVGLRLRDPADYIVSILEVAGSKDTYDDILAAEMLWQRKLNSRDGGLNGGGRTRAGAETLPDPEVMAPML